MLLQRALLISVLAAFPLSAGDWYPDEATFVLFRPETVLALEQLAGAYHREGHDREAEALCRLVLEIQQRTLDANDTRIAIGLNNLAEVYRSSYRYVSAEPLYRRALAIFEANLGPDHPWAARIWNNLASLRVMTGHYTEAGLLFQHALEITRKYAPDSIQLSVILNNLATCAIEEGKFREAEPYLLQAIRIRETRTREIRMENDERVSAEMLRLLENYSLVLRKTRRSAQAKQIETRIVSLRQFRSGQ